MLTMPGLRLFILSLAFPIWSSQAARAVDWQWHTGRATQYGFPDGWSIHEGSCQYYYLDPTVKTGWDIVAPSDANYDYDGGSCGVCYEVACNPLRFTDGYGNQLDRTGVCYDTSSSVVVMVTDVCPCYYPNNMYSNRRWCCGDMQHFDMSAYTFEKLADPKYGVMSIKYRRVPCDYQPAKRAVMPSNMQPISPERNAPAGWNPSKDKRPWPAGVPLAYGATSTTTTSSNPSGSSGSSSSSSGGGSSGGGGSSSSGGNSVSSSSSVSVFYSTLQQGWTDASFSTRKWPAGMTTGPSGSSSYCTTVSAGGAVSFNGWTGAFVGQRAAEMWLKKNDAGTPDFSFQVLSQKGGCRDVRLPSLSYVEIRSDWMRFVIPLNALDWRSPDWSQSPAAFRGCSNQIADKDMTTMQLKNNRGYDQWLCLDGLKMY